jgi:hypothetical protein
MFSRREKAGKELTMGPQLQPTFSKLPSGEEIERATKSPCFEMRLDDFLTLCIFDGFHRYNDESNLEEVELGVIEPLLKKYPEIKRSIESANFHARFRDFINLCLTDNRLRYVPGTVTESVESLTILGAGEILEISFFKRKSISECLEQQRIICGGWARSMLETVAFNAGPSRGYILASEEELDCSDQSSPKELIAAGEKLGYGLCSSQTAIELLSQYKNPSLFSILIAMEPIKDSDGIPRVFDLNLARRSLNTQVYEKREHYPNLILFSFQS